MSDDTTTTPAADAPAADSTVDLSAAVEAATTPAADSTPEAPETPEPETSEQDGKTFTQAEVDDIIRQRLGRAEKAHAKEIEKLKETAGMSEAEATTHKIEALEKTNSDLAAELAQVRVDYALRTAALTAGVPVDQTEAITRLADTSALTNDDGELDAEKITAAVNDVVTRYPGLAGTHTPAASDPVGSGPATADPVRKQPENLMDAVLAKFGG